LSLLSSSPTFQIDFQIDFLLTFVFLLLPSFSTRPFPVPQLIALSAFVKPFVPGPLSFGRVASFFAAAFSPKLHPSSYPTLEDDESDDLRRSDTSTRSEEERERAMSAIFRFQGRSPQRSKAGENGLLSPATPSARSSAASSGRSSVLSVRTSVDPDVVNNTNLALSDFTYKPALLLLFSSSSESPYSRREASTFRSLLDCLQVSSQCRSKFASLLFPSLLIFLSSYLLLICCPVLSD